MSVSAQTSTNTLPDLVPAYPEIPPTFWEQHKTAIVLGAVVLAVLAVLAIWRLLRPRPVPALPSEKIAREALARLQAQPEDGKLLSEVSLVLRRYVGATFAFPGGEMTTAEFCAAILRQERIGPELSGAISSFLRECDVRKFSPANLATPVNAASRALEIIERVEKQRAVQSLLTSAATKIK